MAVDEQLPPHDYILIIQKRRERIQIRIQSPELGISAYEVRSRDRSVSINFYPYRAALFKLDHVARECNRVHHDEPREARLQISDAEAIEVVRER